MLKMGNRERIKGYKKGFLENIMLNTNKSNLRHLVIFLDGFYYKKEQIVV